MKTILLNFRKFSCKTFFYCLIPFLFHTAHGQQIKLYPGAYIVNTGADVVVNGNFENSGTIINTGASGFNTSGNFINNGTFNAGPAVHAVGGCFYNNGTLNADSCTLIRNNNGEIYEIKGMQATASKNLLRLAIQKDGRSDETIIRFIPQASTAFDAMYDAYKLFGYPEVPQLYTLTSDDKKASINSFPLNELYNTKVTMDIRVTTTGICKIVASSLFTFDKSIAIELEDTKLNKKQLLSVDSVYTFEINDSIFAFNTEGNNSAGRFIISFYKKVSDIQANKLEEIKIYNHHKCIYVNINGVNSSVSEMTVLNMFGQPAARYKLISDSVYKTELADGMYIVRVIANGKLYEKKLYLSGNF